MTARSIEMQALQWPTGHAGSGHDPVRVVVGRVMVESIFRAAALIFCAGIVAPQHARAAVPDKRAEVQINLCATPEAVADALHLEPVAAERYEVWYVETADLGLARKGITVRLRIKAGAAELTLKFADQDCERVAPALLSGHRSKCEYDVRGGRAVGAVSTSRPLDHGQARALVAAPGGLPSLLAAGQIDFLRHGVSVWPLPAPLVSLGPVQVQPYRHAGDDFGVEVWRFPSGQRFLEISQKTTLANAARLDAELRGRLSHNRIDACADQSSPAGQKLHNLLGR